MPFDWTNFGNGLEGGGNNLIANRFANSPVGGAYNSIAPMAGGSLIGQSGQPMQQQQPTGNQAQQTDPAQLHYDDWKSKQPAPDQPLSFDNSKPQHSDTLGKIMSIVAAFA